MERDERGLASHFAFGENWSRYARVVNDDHLEAATTELVRLLGRSDLWGLRFLDIGCGSGLHAVAAARLGATVTAVDLDPASVRTTSHLAERFGVASRVSTEVASVFELDPADGGYDIVYSWGVLHHTGDMWEAVRRASAMVRLDGTGELVLALYRRTRFCRFWKVEKRLYSKSPRPVQALVRAAFTVLTDLRRAASGLTPRQYRRQYRKSRGMAVKFDIHDWLGGYPYESVAPRELRSFLAAHGFLELTSFVHSNEKIPWQPFGSGCDEYRFARAA